MTNCPSGMCMLAGHLDRGGLGEGDGVFQIGHARNQHWSPSGSKRRKRNAFSRFDHDPPPRRLARSPARRGPARCLRRAYGPPVRPRHHHAEPGAAGDEGGGGQRLSRTHPRRRAEGFAFRAVDDLLPDRWRRSGRADARQGRGRVGRRQALSGARHDKLRAWCDVDGSRSRKGWRPWRRPACRFSFMAR